MPPDPALHENGLPTPEAVDHDSLAIEAVTDVTQDVGEDMTEDVVADPATPEDQDGQRIQVEYEEPEAALPRRRRSLRRRIRRGRLRIRLTARRMWRRTRGSVARARAVAVTPVSLVVAALVAASTALVAGAAIAPLPVGLRATGMASAAVVAALGVASGVVVERVRRAEARARMMVRDSTDLILITDEGGVVRHQSQSGTEILGYRPGELVHMSLVDMSHPDEAGATRQLLEETLRAPGDPFALELRMRHADGSWRSVEARARNLQAVPGVSGVLVSIRDLSERQALEAEVTHQAFHDPLTGLANRFLFQDRVDHALTRRGNPLPSVLFVDLDGFKAINDSLGHVVGDRMLVTVADRLRACVRPEDTVARLGGDEFAVLLDDVADPRDVGNVASRILEAIHEPYRVGGKDVYLTCSVGVAVHETEGTGELMRDADVALYMAKAQGKGRFVVFDPRMHASTLERLELEADLRRAVERGEFVLFYQPVVELRSERIVGVEALVRWKHPERGILLPQDFIPLAEDTDLIVEMGRWVVGRASEQAQEWNRAFPTDPPLSISVNLSATELRTGLLAEGLARAFAEVGMDPSTLTVEFTESSMLGDADATIAILKELKELGVRLAVDDFGAGQSSLAHLQRFPVDVLKIDPSFVDGIDRGPEDSALARAIVKLAQMLQLEVVAEGVEREGQLALLRELGCHMAQGFLFARPLDEATMTALLERAAAVGKLGLPKRETTSAAPAKATRGK
jgi:diguanylate cyclase (GGDEF)-like protein/PAS domain S-box-containing protein